MHMPCEISQRSDLVEALVPQEAAREEGAAGHAREQFARRALHVQPPCRQATQSSKVVVAEDNMARRSNTLTYNRVQALPELYSPVPWH